MLKLSDKEFAQELQLLEAAKLYESGRLSSGKAARLAGMDRVSFLQELQRIGVPAINLRDEEIAAEIQSARDLAGGHLEERAKRGSREKFLAVLAKVPDIAPEPDDEL